MGFSITELVTSSYYAREKFVTYKAQFFPLRKIQSDLVLFFSCFQCHEHVTNLVRASKNPPLMFLFFSLFFSLFGPIFYLQNGEFRPGPALPIPLEQFCGTKVDSNRLFVAGGFRLGRKYRQEAFLLDWTTQEWTQLPDMTVGRFDHACGFARNPDRIVVVGGFTEDVEQRVTSEILDLTSLTWSAGPGIPDRDYLAGTAALPYRYFFVILKLSFMLLHVSCLEGDFLHF